MRALTWREEEGADALQDEPRDEERDEERRVVAPKGDLGGDGARPTAIICDEENALKTLRGGDEDDLATQNNNRTSRERISTRERSS